MRFALKEVCFLLIWKVRLNNPKRYWSVFSLVIKWAWFCFEHISGYIVECSSSWNTFCSTDRLTLVSSIRILKLNILRHERFSSFAGKFTWGKTRFCWIFRKVTNTSKWKLKLDINHLKKYLIWNFHLVWPAQFREWSVDRICGHVFYNKI